MKFKLVFSSLLLVIGLLFFVGSANAQTTTPTPNNYLNTNPDVPQNLNTYTQSVFLEIASTISCQLTGSDPTNPSNRCLGIDPNTHRIGFVQGGGGAVGMMGNLISMTFYIPVSTHDYGAYMAGNFGITKKTYAADTPSAQNVGAGLSPGATPPGSRNESSLGYNALSPTIHIWETFRNMTYMIFVILFVIVGLGIMFRVKIDPRTVMTLQNQIPKIIMAIVFVTFSYAIAGFLVDFMYVMIYLIVSIFAQNGIDSSSALSSNPFGAVGGIGGMSGIASGVSGSISGIVKNIFDGTLGNVLGAIVGGLIGRLIGSAVPGGIPLVGSIFSGVTTLIGTVGGALYGAKLLGWVAGAITYIVIIIAIFSALLRLWFQLIKCYIYVLINTVLGPFYIASGLIPGRAGIGSWIKSMLANLSVFPVTIAMFLLGKTFIGGFTGATPGVTPFIPPLVGDIATASNFGSIIGLGIILMTPEVVNIVRDALKAPEFKFAGSIGKSVGAGAGIASGLVKESVSTYRAYTTTAQQKLGEKGLGGVVGRIFH